MLIDIKLMDKRGINSHMGVGWTDKEIEVVLWPKNSVVLRRKFQKIMLLYKNDYDFLTECVWFNYQNKICYIKYMKGLKYYLKGSKVI